MQRLRGRVAAYLGFDAIEMNDEHGTSYLIVNQQIKWIPALEGPDILQFPLSCKAIRSVSNENVPYAVEGFTRSRAVRAAYERVWQSYIYTMSGRA